MKITQLTSVRWEHKSMSLSPAFSTPDLRRTSPSASSSPVPSAHACRSGERHFQFQPSPMGPYNMTVFGASFWLLIVLASATDNVGNQLVEVVNANRTAHKSTSLFDNPGLGCLALQYIKAYQGKCKDLGDGKKPPDSSFVEIFAPNCGVAATSLSPITGRMVGCQDKYVLPADAFNDLLVHSERSLEIVYSKNHTQIGAAVSGTDGGSPYFWCVLFSSGKPNNTFTPDNGVVKVKETGCFSGTSDACSGSAVLHPPLWLPTAMILLLQCFLSGFWMRF